MVIQEHHIQAALAAQKRKEKYFSENPIPEGFKECGRCNGLGVLNIYSHRIAGICFKCKGARIVKTKN